NTRTPNARGNWPPLISSRYAFRLMLLGQSHKVPPVRIQTSGEVSDVTSTYHSGTSITSVTTVSAPHTEQSQSLSSQLRLRFMSARSRNARPTHHNPTLAHRLASRCAVTNSAHPTTPLKSPTAAATGYWNPSIPWRSPQARIMSPTPYPDGLYQTNTCSDP